jgi:very-short-patch-repair endonuclease
VITIAQLHAAGLSDDAVLSRVRGGRLHRVHRGIYAVGHRRLPVEGRWMAAVLACGERSALSHRSAAALWGLLPKTGPAVGAGGPIDVLAPYAVSRRRRAGIRLHRSRSFLPSSIVNRDGIPVTNPARTIADLRHVAAPADVRRAIRRAEVLGLRTELAPRTQPTRSDLEDLFLAFCQRHDFPPPKVNRWIAGHEVDFTWPDLKVAVETDSHRFHRGATAFENDHERDLDLRAAGYDVVRLTWRQLTHKPGRCAAAVADALRDAAR